MAIRLYKPTSPARRFMSVLSYEGLTKKALLVLPERDEMVVRAANNIPGVKTAYVNTINVLDILSYDKFIVTEAAVKLVEEVYA